MTEFKYSLDKSSKKFICPSCGKRRFVRYINQITNEYLKKLMEDATGKQVVVITIIQNKMIALQ